MIASARRVLASRAALAAGSLLVGGGVGAAFSARASAAEKSAMDRVRERAGMPDGTDPWGKPLESVTSQRLANIDVHALAAGRMELVAENLKVPAGGSAEEQLVAQQKMTNILLQTIAVQNEEMCLHLHAVCSLADRWEVRFVEYNVWFKEFQKWFKDNWQ